MTDFFTNLLERIFESDRLGGVARSSQWSSVRREYLDMHPDCQACGVEKKLLKPIFVHHRQPFHLHPEMELSFENLISLCGSCHLTLGHLRSFRSYNKDIGADAATLLLKIKQRP